MLLLRTYMFVVVCIMLRLFHVTVIAMRRMRMVIIKVVSYTTTHLLYACQNVYLYWYMLLHCEFNARAMFDLTCVFK